MKTVVEIWHKAWPDSGAFVRASAQDLERFAALVAAAAKAEEREACAKVCDDWPNGRDDVYSIGQAIRARGETK